MNLRSSIKFKIVELIDEHGTKVGEVKYDRYREKNKFTALDHDGWYIRDTDSFHEASKAVEKAWIVYEATSNR